MTVLCLAWVDPHNGKVRKKDMDLSANIVDYRYTPTLPLFKGKWWLTDGFRCIILYCQTNPHCMYDMNIILNHMHHIEYIYIGNQTKSNKYHMNIMTFFAPVTPHLDISWYISSGLLRAWSTDISFTEADCWWISFPGFPSRKPKPSRRLWRPWPLVERWPIWIRRHRGEIDEFPPKTNQDEPGTPKNIPPFLAAWLISWSRSVQQCSTVFNKDWAPGLCNFLPRCPVATSFATAIARLCDFSPFPEIRSQTGHQNIGNFMAAASTAWDMDMPWYAVI